jgi:hypothetical protein
MLSSQPTFEYLKTVTCALLSLMLYLKGFCEPEVQLYTWTVLVGFVAVLKNLGLSL